VVDRLEREHGRVVITKHGRPAAVMLSPEDLESLEETLAILSDPEPMAELRQADVEVAAGRTIPLSKQEALASSPNRIGRPLRFELEGRPSAHRADVYRRG